ncbi:MAG: chaplin family protein, partial [Nocardiopsaceae bacterium]|nr:chaplin family protein [Nocardiopsaceae bacterium]
SIAALGVSAAECTKVTKKLADESGSGDASKTDGSGGTASGNQINIPVDVAIDVCGNSIAALGVSAAECTKVTKKLADESGSGDASKTDGSGGTASGNQVNVPVDAAASICGNSAAVVGVSKAECLKTISEDSGDNGKDEDKGKDDGKGKEEDKEKEEDKDGGKDEDKGKDDGKKDSGKDDADEKGAPADGDGSTSAGGGLPVTGAALGGLVAAAVAAIGGGGTAMYFSRRRKAAAAADKDVEA